MNCIEEGGMQADFVDRFARAWSEPSPDKLSTLLREDVVLIQPHVPAIHGLDAARREFGRLLRWLPALRGTVDHSAKSGNVVFIEWRIHFPIGRGITVHAVDRFRLEGDLAIERRVFFDQTPLVLAILTRPQYWSGYRRYRFGQ
jgi:hypothetical protein